MSKLGDWPHASSLRASVRKQLEAALEFLMAARCFLHFRHGRDDNALSWEAQDEAAARKIGASDSAELTAADWMRLYFRPCPSGTTHRNAVAGRDSGVVVRLTAAISGLALAAVPSRLFRGGWIDFLATILIAAGSRDAAALFSFYGASRPEIKRDHRTSH